MDDEIIREQVLAFAKKDFEKNTVENEVEIILHGPPLDAYIKESYTKGELEKIL